MNQLFLFTLIACSLLLIQPSHFDFASGLLSRESIELSEETVQIAKNGVNKLGDLIKEQYDEISIKESDVDRAKNILRDTKANADKSWDDALAVQDREEDLRIAEIKLKDAKDKLIDYLNQRSTLIGDIKRISDQLVFDKENLSKSGNSTAKLIGIQISRGCELSGNCISIDDLIHLDNSDQSVSGMFVTVDNETKRDRAPMEKSWRFYDHDPTPRVFVDPPHGMNDKIRMITVTNILPIFFEFGDHKINNNTRSYSENRYVDNCRNALVTSDFQLINDTISYFRNGCETTEIETRVTVDLEKTEIDITTSPNWQYTQWLEKAKTICLGLCFEY